MDKFKEYDLSRRDERESLVKNIKEAGVRNDRKDKGKS